MKWYVYLYFYGWLITGFALMRESTFTDFFLSFRWATCWPVSIPVRLLRRLLGVLPVPTKADSSRVLEELAFDLRHAGIYPRPVYEEMGVSGDKWYAFRIDIATELLKIAKVERL